MEVLIIDHSDPLVSCLTASSVPEGVSQRGGGNSSNEWLCSHWPCEALQGEIQEMLIVKCVLGILKLKRASQFTPTSQAHTHARTHARTHAEKCVCCSWLYKCWDKTIFVMCCKNDRSLWDPIKGWSSLSSFWQLAVRHREALEETNQSMSALICGWLIDGSTDTLIKDKMYRYG